MPNIWYGRERLSLEVSFQSRNNKESSVLINRRLPGVPAPDFPSGEGEGQHRGRLTTDYVMQNITLDAQRAMGLAKYESDVPGVLPGERKMLKRANEILGFA